MASLIEAVKRQALITFSSKLTSLSFEENLNKLKLLTNKITCADLKLDKSLFGTSCDSQYKPEWDNRLAPVTYIEVFENPDVTICIFIVRSGARIPLHDHPLMYGILKVIYGTVHVRSYTPLASAVSGSDGGNCHKDDDSMNLSSDIELSKLVYKPRPLFAVKEPEMLLSEKDEPCVLWPRQGNIHEIYSVGGAAAFLDILAPPYETDIPGVGPRPCRYFKDVTQNVDSSVKNLVRIPSPADYWCDCAPYKGPQCETEK